MSKINSQRKNCKDVFNSFLVRRATYAGPFELPILKPTYDLPNKLVPFSKAVSCKDKNQWVHFYEEDYSFERIWRNPKRYLKILKEYNGVILPDFSVYRDMPYVMQLWNIYRSRAIGHWLQKNGIKIIPNLRYGDSRTYIPCCSGIEKHCVIAVGSYGNIKTKTDRKYFLEGLDVVINNLHPSNLVVYGSVPIKYFNKYEEQGVSIVSFNSGCATSHKGVV